jgi:hypothetical protein
MGHDVAAVIGVVLCSVSAESADGASGSAAGNNHRTGGGVAFTPCGIQYATSVAGKAINRKCPGRCRDVAHVNSSSVFRVALHCCNQQQLM